MTSLHHNHNMRFMNLIKQPDSPDPNPDSFEFDESDVVWSADTVSISSQYPSSLSISPTALRRPHHFNGLSAALSDDHNPLVRRKSALNPLSVATATKNISPKPHESHSGPRYHQSAPVNVPVWPKKFGGNFEEIEEEKEEEAAEEMVPPHEIVARSHVTFSVFEGVGRTLKGRDLRRVRNAVFQKTGFLD